MSGIVKIQGKNPNGKPVTLDKSQPMQMTLFQTFLGDGDNYSNTIDLYDAIPKYSPSRKLNALREHGKYLPILKRHFKHRNRITGEMTTYHVTIEPARYEDHSGQEKEYYPTEREELVEEALRKIATDQRNGCYLSEQAGVQFSLKALRKELTARGHAMRHDSIVEALNICSKTLLTVTTADGQSVLTAPIFPQLLMSNRQDWLLHGKDARCYVQFNPLMTHSVNRITYRQFDYATLMSYRRQLARWFHKRLSHNFINADHLRTFDILATTIIRDSGLLNAKQFRDNLQAIDTVLNELKEKQTISDYQKAVRRDKGGRKIEDVLYALYPHHTFIQGMKTANKRQQNINQLAADTDYARRKPFTPN